MIGVNNEFLSSSDLLVNAALNGIYQGIIVAALVAIALRLLPRTNAATRHAVWFFTLFLIVSIIPAHLFYTALLPNTEQNPGTQSRVAPLIVAAGPVALIDSATVPSGVSNVASADDSLVRNSWSQSQEGDGSVSAFAGADPGEMQPPSNDKAGASLLSSDPIPAIQSTAEPGQDKRPVARRSYKSWLISSATTVPLSW